MATPLISINDVTVKEGQDAVFTVSLDQTSTTPITVNWTVPGFSGPDIGSPLNSVLSGMLTFAAGELTKTITIKTATSTATTTSALDVKLIGPTNALLGRSEGVATILDKDSTAAGDPIVTVRDVVVDETAGSAVFTVVLNKPAVGGESFSYQTQDGTATAGQDYTAVGLTTYTFAAGEMVKTIPVTLTNDTLLESDEAFSLVLSSPSGLSLATPTPKATAVIAANDSVTTNPLKLTVQDAAAYEGQGYVDFYVRLDAPSTNTVTVNYSTVNGTALAGAASDYLAQTGTLNFAPGETIKTVRVAVVDDTTAESTENLQLVLSAPANAILGRATGTATIVDNDAAAGTPNISVSSVTVDESSGLAIFTVSLDKPATGLVTVNYGTSDGSAKAGADYTSLNGSLGFAPGETAKTVMVPIIKDTVTEQNESLNLVLSDPAGGTLTTSTGTATIKGDVDNTAPVVSIGNIVLTEATDFAIFTITLDKPVSTPVTFDYTTVNGTAMAGSDFVATAGSSSIPAGATSVTIKVPIIADNIAEGPETFSLQLSNIAVDVDGSTLPISTLFGTATIKDNLETQGAVAVSDIVTTTQGKPISFSVLANDIDPNNGDTGGLYVVFVNGANEVGEISNTAPTTGQITAVGVVSFTTPAGGSATIDSYGHVTYIPQSGFVGQDSFAYSMRDYPFDGALWTLNSAIVNINVTNGQPVAVNDNAVTDMGMPVTIKVLDNDSDPDGDLTAPPVISATPTHGTAVVGAGGAVTYTPTSDYWGVDSFSYTIKDALGHTATAKVTVTVAETAAPVAINEDTTTIKGVAKPINLLADSIYPNHSTLTVDGFTQPAHGTVSFNAAGVGTYTPNDAVYVGADSFTYTIKDNLGRTSTAVVNVTVTNGTALTVAKDTAATLENQAVSIKVLDNDSLPAGATTMSVTAVATPAHGTAAFGFDGTDWRVTYTPALNYTGSDSFTYTVKDDKNNTATGTVNVTVTGGAGVAVTDNLTTSQDRQSTFSLLGNDVDPNNGTTGGLYVVFVNADGVGEIGDTGTLTKIGVTQSSTQAGGQVTIDSYGKGTYVPKAGYVGPDSFTYTLRDHPFNGFYSLSTATVNITVSDGTPRATADTATTASGAPVAVNVLGNDTDPNGDALIISAVSAPAHGTAVNGGGGFVIYTPAQNYSGIDNFTYTVSDGAHTSTGVVSVTVTPATTGTAVAKDQALTTGEDTPSKIDLLKDATNPNKETLTLKAGAVTTAHGKVEIDAGGFAIYTPEAGYVGPDYFNFTMVDSQGRTSAGLVSVTVTQQRPTAVDDTAATGVGKPISINVLSNDTDPQNDPLTVSAVKTAPTNGTATIASDGKSITYTPAANFSGSDSFVYTASDGKGHTASATVNVAVTSGIPAATDDSATTSQGVPVEISVLDNDSDPEGDPLSVIAVSVPGHGTAALGKSGVITYTPSSGFYGLDYFTYTISDGQGHTASAFVDVLVTGVNRAPTLANPIPDQTGVPTQAFFRYTLPANTFSDPDPGDVLTYSARLVDGSALPSWLVFDPGSHDFLGSPDDGDVGSFNVKVTATDRSFATASDTFTVSVVPRTTSATTPTTTTPVPQTTDTGTPAAANQAPTTADNAASLKEGGAYAFAAASFPFSDADAGDALQSVTVVSLPADGQLKLAGSLVQAGQSIARADLDSGRLTYEAPAPVKDWAQSFAFQVSDGKSASSNTGLFSLDLVPSGAAIRGTDAGERLKGAGKADLLLGQGGNDTLDGKGGGDRLYGEDGKDALKGGAGNDFLSGGAGDDKLYGQDGKDVLAGGAGSDLLDGGAGKDVYLYGAKAFGVGDLAAGDHDIIKATKGDCIAFDASLWAHLTQNHAALDDLAGQPLDGQITSHSNIAYDGHSVMIDLNGDGDFVAAQDLTIEILGQAQKVAVDPTGQFLVIG